MLEPVARAIAYQDLNGRLLTEDDRLNLVNAHWHKSTKQAAAAIGVVMRELASRMGEKS